MKYKLKCQYCGISWIEETDYPMSLKYLKCPHCDDRNIDYKEIETLDYYGDKK